MPQATDEQRALMTKWFGEIGDEGPALLLQSRGYWFSSGWIVKPTRGHTISEIEGECIDFLCDEWDYGFDPEVWAPQPPSLEEQLRAIQQR